MTEPIVYALMAVFAVSLISLVGLFLIPERVIRIRSFLLFLLGIAVGALLGDSFIHLIPEALEELGGLNTGLWVLGGLGVFFVFEKFLHWHHHHELHINPREECEDCDTHIAPFGKLIIAADALHNITDGAIIAAGFLISVEVGIATTIAVALHEIPQEVGDFGALLHAGFSRTRALLLNFASALSAFLGAIAVFVIGSNFEQSVPVIAALTAGSFIYIAIADLVPELNKSPRFDQSLAQFAAVILGVGLMAGLTIIENGDGHGHGAEDEHGAHREYVSEELGLSFEYPQNYFITEREVGDAHRTHYSIMLVEDTSFNRDLVAGKIVGTEGPPAITIDAYQNNLDEYTTESWVRGHSASNYKLSDGALTPVQIGGRDALRYHWSGLYEADNIAVATPVYVFSFVVTYLTPEDVIRDDFAEIIETVQFE